MISVCERGTLDDGVLPDLTALIELIRPKGVVRCSPMFGGGRATHEQVPPPPVVIVTLPSLAIYACFAGS